MQFPGSTLCTTDHTQTGLERAECQPLSPVPLGTEIIACRHGNNLTPRLLLIATSARVQTINYLI